MRGRGYIWDVRGGGDPVAIRVTCACGKVHDVADSLAGRQGHCAACGALLLIPSTSPALTLPGPTHATVAKLEPFDDFALERPPLTELAMCRYCGEEIAAQAVKCRHCGEFLTAKLRRQAEKERRRHPVPAGHPSIVIQNSATAVVASRGRRWSRIVAGLLSIVPGLGQLYKGQPLNAVLWFVVVAIGYAAMVAPGIVLHLCCLLGAMSGDTEH